MADWLGVSAKGELMLTLHVQPNARRTEVAGLHGDALKLRLAAPPADGKANACLIEFIAELLDVPRVQVELLSGAGSRRKVLRITGAALEAVATLRKLAES